QWDASTKATKPNSTTPHCTAFAPGSRNDARRGAVDRKHPRRNPERQLPNRNKGQNHRPTQREALGERRDNDTQTDGGRRQDIRATASNNLGQQLPRQIGGDAEETRKGTTRANCVDRDQNRASKRGARGCSAGFIGTGFLSAAPPKFPAGPIRSTQQITPVSHESKIRTRCLPLKRVFRP
ncbi:hypothetical protein MTP99_004839, partial [Tenebrio molitor]